VIAKRSDPPVVWGFGGIRWACILLVIERTVNAQES
jgi:hypothetical protein